MAGWNDTHKGPSKGVHTRRHFGALLHALTIVLRYMHTARTELQGDYDSTVESPAMLRLRKTSQTAALRRSSMDAVRSPVSPRTPGKNAGDCVQ